jgi:probable HAF family extracellular repeat protein
MKIHRFLVRGVAAAVIVAAPLLVQAQSLPTFHVTNISATAPMPNCIGLALNDAGTIAGSCDDASLHRVAVTLRGGTLVNYGFLSTGNYASPTAINSLGVVVGDADPGNGRPNPFVTLKGKLLNVDPVSGGNARAVGIMDNGVIFGNLTKSLSGNAASWIPEMWTVDSGHPDRYRENALPKLAGGDPKLTGAFLTASNKAGQAAGWVTNAVIGQLGGFWNSDATHSVVALQALADGNHSVAWGLNDLGQVVGESNSGASVTRAVLWQNDASHSIVDLGALPGDFESIATGINNAGQVIGTSQVSILAGAGNDPKAFFWQNGSMVELASLIDPADGAWIIGSVTSINNAGQILAMGSQGGNNVSILLTPVAP